VAVIVFMYLFTASSYATCSFLKHVSPEDSGASRVFELGLIQTVRRKILKPGSVAQYVYVLSV